MALDHLPGGAKSSQISCFEASSFRTFEVLAAPASSAADERIYSMAGDVVNDERPNTMEELAEAYQGLRSWYSERLL